MDADSYLLPLYRTRHTHRSDMITTAFDVFLAGPSACMRRHRNFFSGIVNVIIRFLDLQKTSLFWRWRLTVFPFVDEATHGAFQLGGC